jgi:DNA-binding transcriptional LysR family regulator
LCGAAIDNPSVPARKTDKPDLPFRLMAQYWNWIPAFRAVAEAGGVNEAARLLRVSPSALSRSVGLLEAALGETLFFREGGLALTTRGETLLAATRQAMRLMHEAARIDDAFSGPIVLGATSRLGIYRLLPALRAIRERWPRLEPRAVTTNDTDLAPLLLRGQLDVVLTSASVAPSSLAGTKLPPASCHVYCGKGHRLFDEQSPSEETVLSFPFAAPVATTPSPLAADSWPNDLARDVALVCDSLEPAIDACVRGALLICLPDEIVDALGLRTSLRALPSPKLPSTPVLCVHRPMLGALRGVADEIVAVLAAP